jgi:alkylation response protein AidB-like acyl-CoA dehydrogenase
MYRFTEEEAIHAEHAAGFLAKRSPVAEQRRLRDAADATGFDRTLWSDMADLGWAGMLVDPEFGGNGFGFMGVGIVGEAMGRHLTASPFLSTAVMGAVALRHASPSIQDAWLPKVGDGTTVIAIAIDEGRCHDPLATSLLATPRDDGFVLTGTKTLVIDGHVADAIVVLARTGRGPGDVDGLTFFLADPTQPGVAIQRIDMIDSRNVATITFDGVVVPPDRIVGAVGGAAPVCEDIVAAANSALSAELLGIAEESFERTLDYLKIRRQFGVPIGSFQALQHRAAQVHCQIELARSAVLCGMRVFDSDTRLKARQVFVAKAKSSQAAILATDEAIQMHGGIGMTDDVDIGLFAKRARVASSIFGTPEQTVSRFSEELSARFPAPDLELHGASEGA